MLGCQTFANRTMICRFLEVKWDRIISCHNKSLQSAFLVVEYSYIMYHDGLLEDKCDYD